MLRPPGPEEFAALAALCLRSKAHWGYDQAFLEACRGMLEVDPEQATAGLAQVAERDGAVAGIVQVSLAGDEAELDLLFVAPEAMGNGVGRALLAWACDAARAHGARRLVILSDPAARAFYERCGAVFQGMAPSDAAIRGRTLPLLTFDLSA